MTKTNRAPLMAVAMAVTLGLVALLLLVQIEMIVPAPFGVVHAQQRGAPPPTPVDPTAKVFVVNHVDLAPNALDADKSLLLQYVADSRKDPGAVRIELLEQSDRPNHFTLVEVWENQKAFDAHVEADHTKQFRTKIQSGLGSPFDERLHHLLE